MPIFEWLPQYNLKQDLSYDLVAGFTVGMMIVPEEISLSTIMGVPPTFGLYTAAIVPMIYPLFGTSRVLSVANGAEVALLVGSAIKKIQSVEERIATGILISFLIGFLQFMMGIFHLGILADFFSRPVMGGFVSAGGVLIMLSQCANLMGVTVPGRDLPILTVLDLMEKSMEVNMGALALGLFSIAILACMSYVKQSALIELHCLEEQLEKLCMSQVCEKKVTVPIELSPVRLAPLSFPIDRDSTVISAGPFSVPRNSPIVYRNSLFQENRVGLSLSDEDYMHLDPPEIHSARLTDTVDSHIEECIQSVRNESHTNLCSMFQKKPFKLFSMPMRVIRSKIAVLVALRLICDLSSFFVCLFGGIVGYLAGDKLILTGKVPGGYPTPILPWYGFFTGVIEADRMYHIIIDTLSIALIAYMSSIAMAKRLAIKEGYRVRPNQELIALGMANLIGSFFQAMPSSGGLSRTAVNVQNARTQLASLISSFVVIIALYTATSAVAFLPKTSLSAIIIVSGYALIESKEAKWLFRVKREEFYVWLASFSLTVLLGVLPGLICSILSSLIAVLYKTRRPTVTMLGHLLHDPQKIVELELYPDTCQTFEDLIVFRVEGALYFANCEYIEQVIHKEIAQKSIVKGVIMDARAILDCDSTTVQMLQSLQLELSKENIHFAIVHAQNRLQRILESYGFHRVIVLQNATIDFAQAMDAIRSDTSFITKEEF